LIIVLRIILFVKRKQSADSIDFLFCLCLLINCKKNESKKILLSDK